MFQHLIPLKQKEITLIYTVTLNPALDKTVEIENFTVNAVNRITSVRTDPGGKGINVSKVIDKLGYKSIATGILAGDTGRTILSAIESIGLASYFHFVKGETRTNLKVIDPVAHTNTDINEPGIKVTEEHLNKLLNELLEMVKEDDCVVISGSVPKGSPPDTYYTWTKAFLEKGAKVFLDADGELLKEALKASPYLIKPNNFELSALIGKELKTVKELEEAARNLLVEYGIEKIVVSLGQDGLLYVSKEETIHAEGLKVPVGSTVGAGDSVVAALVVAKTTGMSLEETVCLASATGAANVMCSGSQAAEYEVIEKLIPQVIYHRI